MLGWPPCCWRSSKVWSWRSRSAPGWHSSAGWRAREGALEAADAIWGALEHDAPVEVRIQAAYARTELLLEAGQLEPAAAIARLAATRGLWPGHPWEERMLGGLAQIYADAGDRANALRAWRELLDRYPGTADAPVVTERMRDVLIEALRAEADLGPVQAYALFRDFEQLLAHDGLGDDVRRGLARRLAEIDLIRPAAALLEALLADRLAGIDKAAAGADLAELWLREPAPGAALGALERSRGAAALPPALDQRRRILEADALARLERRSAALALLDGLHTPAADRLRIGILWQEEDWPAVASALEHALARREARQPLTDDEQAMVLQLAVAHGRLGQGAALARLRARFAAALRGLPIEPAFLMATAAPAPAGDPEAVLAAAERHLREVRGYLRAEQASN